MAALALALYTLIGLIIGYGVSKLLRMPPAKGKAMTFVVGVQNTALAVTLGVTYFDPLARYTGSYRGSLDNCILFLVASVWGNRTPDPQQENINS